jgi:hypothetical protein
MTIMNIPLKSDSVVGREVSHITILPSRPEATKKSCVTHSDCKADIIEQNKPKQDIPL